MSSKTKEQKSSWCCKSKIKTRANNTIVKEPSIGVCGENKINLLRARKPYFDI